MRIFIADDSAEAAEMLARQLRHRGHDVVGVTNDAHGIANAVRPYALAGALLVLMDVDWPAGRGYGVEAARICKRETGAIVYLCSARSPMELRAAKNAGGVDGWFSKDADEIAGRLVTLERLWG